MASKRRREKEEWNDEELAPRKKRRQPEESNNKRRKSVNGKVVENGKKASTPKKPQENGTQSHDDDQEVEEEIISAEDDKEEEEPVSTGRVGGSEQQVGVLEKVTLINFMCHKHLEVKFGPNVNFIIGRNGSGKSAVLVALTIGLGAKTGFSGRGHKLADLINKKASAARIIIRMNNRGEDAFKKDIYGDTITVERQLSKDGRNAYLLKNHQNKIVSKKRADLQELMEHFYIHIDNPCEILMQDTSRQFLVKDSPKDKYHFFLTGTVLYQLEQELEKIKDLLPMFSSVIASKEKGIPDSERRVKELEDELRVVQHMKGLEEQIKGLKKALLWAFVREKEKKLTMATNQMQKSQQQSDKLAEKKREEEVAAEKIKARQAELLSQLDELNKIIRKHHEGVREIDASVRSASNEVKVARAAVAERKSKLSTLTGRLGKLHQFISEARAKISADRQAEQEQRQAEINEKTTDLEHVKIKQTQMKQTEQAKGHQINELSSQIHELSVELQTKESNLRKVKGQIDQLGKQKNNVMAAFGQEIPALIELIDRNARTFEKKPVGPVGRYITVLHDKWRPVIETRLRGGLRNFICHSDHDRKVLRSLAERNRIPPPPIYIQPYSETQYNDIPRSRDPRVLTIDQAIRVSDPWVYNVIIDQLGPEKIALEEDEERAKALAWRGERDSPITSVLTPEGYEFIGTGGSETRIAPTRTPTSTMLSPNVDAMIAQARETERTLTEQVRNLRAEKQQKEHDRAVLDREAKANATEMRKLDFFINKLSKEIQELSNYEEEAIPDVEEMERNAANLQGEVEVVRASFNEADKILSSALEKHREAEKRKRDYDSTITNYDEDSERIASETTKVEEKLALFEAKIDAFKKKQDELVAALRAQQEETRKLELEVKKMIEDATLRTGGQRIEENRSPEQLQAKIVGFCQQLEKQQKEGRPFAEVKKDYTESKKKLDYAVKMIGKFKARERLLADKLVKRTEKRVKMLLSISKQTKLYFNAFLSQRGFAGSLELNHNARELKIQVQPQGRAAKDVSDTRQLSGGERSYSTVTLLLAIWSNIESPFRAMDEFDVFMDAGARQITIDMLVEYAKHHPQRQFIFISPQDRSVIKYGDNIKVFHMPDPEVTVSQSILPFGNDE
eukprot:TRINITY_DN9919_c0_g2_i3.p1 TRINITY_DN9919_c0_g2~~TRINITY_DN9919_c0_g2_i3.p1  ORF type:complete len:1137 (+),score=245.74 TRINITY_DN9919_c0_g2_i3:152-3562(+)